MNILKWVALNIVAILFLLGLTLINIAVYLHYGVVLSLVSIGVTFILIAIIAAYESS